MRNRKALARAVFATLSLLISAWIYLAPGSVVGQFMRLLKWVVTAAFVLFELAVAAWIFRWVFHETTEQSERRIASELHWLPDGLLRSLLMVEVRVWLYGLKRSRLSQWEGANFSYAAQGDNANMQQMFLWMMLAELVIAHFFLSFILSDFWRWIIFFLTLYAMFWMFAEWRATTMRPISIRDDALHVRYGVLHSFVVPLGDIESVSSASIYDVQRNPIKLAGFGSPNVALVLNVPVRTTFGKQTSALAIAVDQPKQFMEALLHGMAVLERSAR
ncbi:hypothetical protein GCM10027431_11120 [Lysobacter rhizosphaerae]